MRLLCFLCSLFFLTGCASEFDRAHDRAEGGDPDAQLLLGNAYYFDNISGLPFTVEHDPERGLAWIERAAAQNHGPALYTLGFLHRMQDENETARGYYLQAAENGLIEGYENAALTYSAGMTTCEPEAVTAYLDLMATGVERGSPSAPQLLQAFVNGVKGASADGDPNAPRCLEVLHARGLAG